MTGSSSGGHVSVQRALYVAFTEVDAFFSLSRNGRTGAAVAVAAGVVAVREWNRNRRVPYVVN